MRLSMHAALPRVWSVELHPQAGGPVLACQRCAPRATPLEASSARSAALRHLALHARMDTLAGHLRTCQCRQRGCPWHARHRGCAGPVRLALAREHGGRGWRLADVCAACAHAIPHTAIVPDPLPAATPPAASAHQTAQPARRLPGPTAVTRVREMLSYLAAALPACTAAESRLLALQCALRADTRGRLLLARGVLRSMRMAHSSAPWRELEQAQWLRRPANSPTKENTGSMRAVLLDAAVLTQVPGRHGRAQAADWALRTLTGPAVRDQTATARLITLQLAVYTLPDSPHGRAEADQLARAAGLSHAALTTILDQLAATGALQGWGFDPVTDEVAWELSVPIPSVPAPPEPGSQLARRTESPPSVALPA
ncbi:hypothetical protein [Streptomyces apocyni]|uniref:hypothetical protein n=1 Tax=Streptomyces apocyni TaxID=2654677 RepID=UPI0018D09277|nr:hypothetical protein [Streptomyces apocyni]